jgi:hypothetical protein
MAEMATLDLLLVVVVVVHLKPELPEDQLGAREAMARHLLFQAL